ncbi:MAG TPA: alpha/beta hydrolase [Deltaproteobacteria bacterium]|nr:alpha/beta hydrolase [Deltaproteobacteria bacterium]
MKTHRLPKWIIGELRLLRVIRSTLIILVLVYGFFLLYGIFVADTLIFYPHPSSYGYGDPYVHIPSPTGDMITIRELGHPDARYTILYSHGNAEDLGDLEGVFQAFLAHGFSVAAYDYSGYGTSTGTPSEKATYTNILAVYEYLLNQRKLHPDQILVLGRSVGGGPSVELSTRYRVGGLILESAFTSVFRMKTRIAIFPFDPFNNLGKIPSASCPVLVIHGRQDEMIPFRHGQTLYERAPSPKMHLWVDGAHHNDLLWTAGESYWKTLAEFTELVDARARPDHNR